MRVCLARGEYMDLTRVLIVARTEVTAIIGLLSFGTKCTETSRPRCGLCFDLSIVRVDGTRPFPLIKIVRDIVPLRHGSVSDVNATGFDEKGG